MKYNIKAAIVVAASVFSAAPLSAKTVGIKPKAPAQAKSSVGNSATEKTQTTAPVTKKAKALSKKVQAPKKHKIRVIDPAIETAIAEAAAKENVPVSLLWAICYAESNLHPKAFVFSDGGHGNHAIGMCQVLPHTSKVMLRNVSGCERDFRDPELARNYDNCKLFGPKTNALVAARYLKLQIERYNGNLLKASAAYNSGTPKLCNKSGWAIDQRGNKMYPCEPGRLMNQVYVERIKTFLRTHQERVANTPEDMEKIERYLFAPPVLTTEIPSKKILPY